MTLFNLISVVAILSVVAECRGNYYGKLIGDFFRRGNTQADHHNVAGTVYAVDDNTLQIIGFTYDGTASDAFFYIGTSGTPSANGYIIPKAVGLGSEKLGEYSNADLTIHLDTTQGPGSISDYVWISVWCRSAEENFADVYIPADFTPPEEYSLGRLGFSPPLYDVSADDAIILNSKQIRFVGLTYDGRGPAVYFWMDTQSSSLTSRTGRRVPQVGESSASRLTQRLSGVTRTVQLPGDTTVFDIRSIGLWCDRANANFGHVTIPGDLESRGVVIPFVPAPDLPAYDNCEVLEADEYQVSWTIDGDYIAIGLASRQSFNEYMAFGPSGSDSETTMVGSDVIVAFIDSETSMGRVEDYYLSAYAMCTANDGEGVCPDTLGKPGTNDVTLSGFSTDDGITRINFRRPLSATDQYDRAISTTGPQFISWALGPINEDGRATYHGPDNRTPENKQINFGRERSSCPAFTMRTSDDTFNSFEVDPIIALEDAEFRCDIGRAGGQKGYQGITGKVGWGISWYINGNLIPEITVKRNQTYTFKVYGGSDPSLPASYHPFYITTDSAGGYYQLPDAARGNHDIIAGPVNGSYCFYDDTADTPNPDDTDTYQEYRDTLQLNCPNGDGSPGTLVWTPDANTPDLVFYQCYTHRFLGWKIHVTDDANKCVLSLITMVTTIITAILIMFRNA